MKRWILSWYNENWIKCEEEHICSEYEIQQVVKSMEGYELSDIKYKEKF